MTNPGIVWRRQCGGYQGSPDPIQDISDGLPPVGNCRSDVRGTYNGGDEYEHDYAYDYDYERTVVIVIVPVLGLVGQSVQSVET